MEALPVVSRLMAAAIALAPALLQAQPAGAALANQRPLATTTIAVVVGGRMLIEGFTFGLGAQRVTFAAGSWTGFTYEAPKSFTVGVVRGSPYAVTQVDGPRTCSLYNSTGAAAGGTIYVYADCNAQPTKYLLGLRVIGFSDSDTLTFATDGGDRATHTKALRTAFFPGGATAGATMRVWRVARESTRSCTLTGDAPWAVSTVGDTVVVRAYSDVYITASCPPVAPTTAGTGGTSGAPPTPVTSGGTTSTAGGGVRGARGTILPPSSRIPIPTGSRAGPGTSSLGGTVRGPVGLRPSLTVNGGTPLVVTIPPLAGSTDPYNEAAFSFTPPRANGTSYTVAATSQNANATCTPYVGQFGIMPAPGNPVRIGCEFLFDHVSTNTGGGARATYYESKDVVIGGDEYWGEGRFVAFMSNAAGLSDKKPTARQIYWRDRMSGETLLISAAADGTPGNADSFAPAISADGLTVAFESDATNLVDGDGNKVRDVFVWSSAGGAYATSVFRANVGPGGIEANAPSSEATVSGDGRVIAFTSSASNLTPGVPGTETPNVFRRDTKAGATTLVTRGLNGPAVGGSKPSISEDGMRIAFQSFSNALVSGDKNGLWDIFVHDFSTGGLQRVSVPQGGGERNQGEESASRIVAPVISGDGNVVAFTTTATNLVPGVTKALQNVYVMDLQSGRLIRASVSTAGAEGDGASPIEQGERPALSYDGTWVAFPSSSKNFGAPEGNIFLHNNRTGETRPLTTRTNNSAGAPSMSRRAAYVAFGSNNQYDARVPSSGQFVAFTSIANAWLWVR